jgi:dipeptidyl aminopeptidase/acylaminoacyl peptidase
LKILGSSTESDATRGRRILLRVVAALAVAAALPACAGDEDEQSPETAARLAAVRAHPGNPPSFNPPRFHLLTLKEDGSDERVVLRTPMTGGTTLLRLSDASWSPDARWIYFTGVVEERETERLSYDLTDVFAVRPDGSGLRRLTATGDAGRPVPSPDGETLLFMRSEHPARLPFTSGLWLMAADGTRQRRLLEARDGRLDLPGSWSPDGETIVFTRCDWVLPRPDGLVPNTCTVQKVTRTGSDVTQLAERATEPVYSPDGERIAFVTDRDENGLHATGSDENAFANELYVMDSDGGDAQRLTETDELDEGSPSWSADGERVAYEREGPARFTKQLMIVPSEGGCAARIAGDAAISDVRRGRDYSQPVWRPGTNAGTHPELECEEDG